MADEIDRTIKIKRIPDPSDPNPSDPANYVDVPVITEIKFKAAGNGQVYVKSFDNTQDNNARQTHVHTVKNQSFDGDGNVATDDENSIDVERIDSIRIRWADQIEVLGLLNNDPPPLGPNDDPSQGHHKTHVVRYNKDNMNDPDAEPWLDVELIDELKEKGYFKGISREADKDAGQIVTFVLSGNDSGDDSLNATDDPFKPTFSKVDTSLDYLPPDNDGSSEGPVPARIDPFQNIVNVNWGGLAVEFYPRGT